MKKTNDLFLITAIVCGFSSIVNLTFLFDQSLTPIYFAIYLILAILGIVCAIFFIIFYKKDSTWALARKTFIKTICIINNEYKNVL